ncbi:hypothetical protein B0T14DRAFT_531723 [Immersiella caudata]|uniref:Uncharacterized protein n=1 Tax=Immersiella caudata TaxID=314043 RepID=A0AA39U6R8_9PEZI|nr:hypothetical protein B0T14DRAFT_531723 [Immersiella caudata]
MSCIAFFIAVTSQMVSRLLVHNVIFNLEMTHHFWQGVGSRSVSPCELTVGGRRSWLIREHRLGKSVPEPLIKILLVGVC